MQKKWTLKNKRSNRSVEGHFVSKAEAIAYAKFLVGDGWEEVYVPVTNYKNDPIAKAIRLLKANGYTVKKKVLTRDRKPKYD